MDKNEIWSKYVSEGKLKSFLSKYEIEDSTRDEIFTSISGCDYKSDYKIIKQLLALGICQRLAGNIRAAAHQKKNELVNIKVKNKTKDLLEEAQKTTGASSIDETIFYLCEPAYHSDFALELASNSMFSEIGDPSGKPYEWVMLEKMEGYARRLFAHLYLNKRYAKIAAAARNDKTMLNLTQARKEGAKVGMDNVLNDGFHLDFGNENRKLFPAFQFHEAVVNGASLLKLDNGEISDHEWYFRIQSLSDYDPKATIELLQHPINLTKFFDYLNKME